MVIQVPTDVAAHIRQKVESGLYDDPEAVIRSALRLLDKRDQRLQELRALIAEGVADIERGDVDEWTPELMAKIDRAADEQIRLGLPPDPSCLPVNRALFLLAGRNGTCKTSWSTPSSNGDNHSGARTDGNSPRRSLHSWIFLAWVLPDLISERGSAATGWDSMW